MGPTDARFPSVPLDAGHYESYYLRAGHPAERLAVWIRYTVHKRPGQPPRGSLWFTLFDAASGPPRAAKVTLPDLAAGDGGAFISVGDSSFGDGRVDGEALGARWSLEYEPRDAPFEHLPRAWMYGASLPRTKALSPCPAATFRGHVSIDGRQVELDGWPGMVGHNWGAEHAERWVWLHGVAFDGHPDAWLDMTIGRVKLGPLTTPWIANGCLSLGGERLRLGGLERAVSTRVDARPGRCDFTLAGRGARVTGSATAALDNTVGWVYADPAGGEHNTLNCSAAALELTVERSGGAPIALATATGASYELGLRGGEHGVPMQPFPDG